MSKRGLSSLVNRRQWVAGRPNWVSSWPCSLVMLSLGNRLTSISSWLVEHEELEARGRQALPHFSLNRYSMATTLGGHRLCVSWYLMPAGWGQHQQQHTLAEGGLTPCSHGEAQMPARILDLSVITHHQSLPLCKHRECGKSAYLDNWDRSRRGCMYTQGKARKKFRDSSKSQDPVTSKLRDPAER
jgi:hypothetical protein